MYEANKHVMVGVELDDGGTVQCLGCRQYVHGSLTGTPPGECPTPYKSPKQLLDESVAREAALREELAELSAIGALINTQDNRYTDQPMFVVFEKRGMVTLDTHDHDRIEWYNPDSVSTADDHKAKRLEALHDGGRDTPGWERYAVKDIDVFVTACFTEQGCKDFLGCNGHNLNRPFIYAFGSYRNREFQTVRNRLKAMATLKPTDPGTHEREQGIPGTSFQRLNQLANEGE